MGVKVFVVIFVMPPVYRPVETKTFHIENKILEKEHLIYFKLAASTSSSAFSSAKPVFLPKISTFTIT